jgi:hypothetical protein
MSSSANPASSEPGPVVTKKEGVIARIDPATTINPETEPKKVKVKRKEPDRTVVEEPRKRQLSKKELEDIAKADAMVKRINKAAGDCAQPYTGGSCSISSGSDSGFDWKSLLKFTKRTKIICAAVVGGLVLLWIIWSYVL